MVGLVTDSSDSDEATTTELKVSSSPAAADYTVPSIDDLDFSSPLFDSLPDFETLKDYWICQSPTQERFGGSLLGIEEFMDMVGTENGAETKPEVTVSDGAGTTDGVQNQSLSLGGLKVVVSQNGDSGNVINAEHEVDKGSNLGVHSIEADENEALDEVKSGEEIKIEVSGSLSPTIEADLRKVSLDGPGDVPVADKEMVVKAEEKGDEAESDSSSESESESESSLSEAYSSEATSSSDDDDDEEDGVVKRNAELAGQLEEGEIMDEDVEQMVAWSDDEDEVVKGPIRSKNEITDLPPVPQIEVALNPSHQTFPVGVILSIVGKQVIVEGVEKHNPLNEGSILWITESREPLGLVDDIFGPVKNPYYSIRYNNEDEVPSGISIGTPVSFVPEFVNHVLNDASLYRKGYDASNENDEELSEEAEFSDDEKEAEYRRMMKMSKRGSNEEAGGKKKDKRKNRNQERIWNNPRPSPHVNSSEGDLLASNNSQHPSAPETPRNQRNQFSEGGPPFPLSNGMNAPFQHMQHPGSFNLGSNGVWPNGMPIQQQQQPMFFPNIFPTNGMPWMQQNNLVRNPFMSMSMPQGMPFSQQLGHNQMLPANLAFPGPQQIFMGGSSNPPFPGFFGQNNFNQGSGQIMATSVPGASIANIPSSEQNGAAQQPPNIPSNNEDCQQVFSDVPSGRGRNPNNQWRGRSGSRGGRFNRGGRGSGGRGRGRGRHQGN